MLSPTTTLNPARRTFSLEEANRALPYVHRVVADIVTAYGDIMSLRQSMDAPLDTVDTTALETNYERAMDRLGTLVDELNQVGAELRDFELGVVDFPSNDTDPPVCWCWQLGEPTVATWHDPDEGFSAREPVTTLRAQAG